MAPMDRDLSVRPTVHDVARDAGVSLATVDRVLNGRAGVRHQTLLRVEAAIARLGFVRDVTAANLAKGRTYRFVFVIPEGANTFMRQLEAEARAAGQRLAGERISVEVVLVPAFDSAALAAALNGLDTERVSGVALVATESALLREALARLHGAGTPTVTIVSDAPSLQRNRYVGIDNVAAGRTAASLIGRFLGAKRGKIAFVAGSMLVRDHVERRMGFDQVIRGEYPGLEVLPTIEGRDDRTITKDALRACLERETGIVGIYSAGAGNLGVMELLQPFSEADRPVVIAHELTDHTRMALQIGLFHAVINQDAGHEVRSAIRVLRSLTDGSPLVEGQDHIRIEIYLRDNLP